MSDLFAEFGTYLIKYGVFLVLAVAGFWTGTKWRKAKDSKVQKEEEEQ